MWQIWQVHFAVTSKRVFKTLSNIYDGLFFAKTVNGKLKVTSSKKLNHRHLNHAPLIREYSIQEDSDFAFNSTYVIGLYFFHSSVSLMEKNSVATSGTYGNY